MRQAATPPLVLASASGARVAVLTRAGLVFEARAAAIDEAAVKAGARADGASADDAAMLLADLKAARVEQVHPDALVIGCDQILVCEGRWFDKPGDPGEARSHLLALRGRMHMLATAVVCRHDGRRVWQHVARPTLVMRGFSDRFLEDYLAAEGDALTTSVGAYRLEGLGVHLFERVDGEQAAILGLPLLPLLAFLRRHGVLSC